jgi:hypothetical protein
MSDMPIQPDVKDWTWVLEKPCPQCEFDASSVSRAAIAAAIPDNAGRWKDALAGRDVAVRPVGHVWSTLEYACHVRDVHRLFGERVRRMLLEDDPQFPNWDQDATAVEDDYGSQDPAVVARELTEAAAAVAATYDTVEGDQWQRPGTRSNGSVFTVESIGRYHLHDVVHHIWDVRG